MRSKISGRVLWITLMLLLETGVLVKSQPGQWTGKVEKVDGITHIYNPATGLWDNDPSKKLKVVKLLSIGNVNSQKEYIFNWVKDIVTDADGNIYVCDSGSSIVRVFDKNGKYLKTIGGPGKGPGDLLRPLALTINHAGFLFVLDDLNRRISIFKPNGNFHKVFGFRYHGFAHESIALDSNGNVLLSHVLFSTEKVPLLPLITAYSPDGKVVKEFGVQKILVNDDGYGRPQNESYGFCMDPSGKLWIKTSAPYTIQVFQDGTPVKVIHRDSPFFTEPELTQVFFDAKDGTGGKVMAVTQRSVIWKLLVLPDGRFIAVIRDSGNNYKENKDEKNFAVWLDLFDKEGHFLKSYPWDWKKNGLLLYVDRAGYFYSNYGETEEVTGVSKWEISF